MARWVKVITLLSVVLMVVGCSARTDPAPVTRLDTIRAHDYERDVIRKDTYKVVPGDTLYSIAFRSSMDLRQLARLNDLTEPYTIYPGQTLRINYAGGMEPSQTAPSRVQVGAIEKPEIADESTGSEVIASKLKTEYGDREGQKTEPQGTATVPQITQTTPQRERNIRSADIRWRWPSEGQLVRRFSTADTGTRGMEFSGDRGDPVIAAASGRVVYVGSALRGYGQLIILKHNDDYITAYAHNDSIHVREQQWVESGQQIATMGNTGREDVRLRFELRLRGNSVNPENYLPRR